jgi:hypothetical protein
MNRGTLRTIALAASLATSLVAATFLASCTLSTTADVSFAFMPGEIPAYTAAGFDNNAPAPRSPAGGFVYARLVRSGGDGSPETLGPFAVSPGVPFVPEGLSAGKYSSLVLYYSPEPLAEESVRALPALQGPVADFWRAVADPAVSKGILNDSGAVAVYADLKIKRFRKNHLEAALIPLSSALFSAVDGVQPACPDSGGKIVKRFIRLAPGQSQSLYVMLTNFDGMGMTYVGTVSLYSAAGGCVDTKNLNRPITPDAPESILFTMTGEETLYLYVEYEALGDRPLGLFFF